MGLGGASEAVEGILAIVWSTLVIVGLPAAVKTLTRGRTWARWPWAFARCATTRTAHRPPRLVRALVAYVEVYLLFGMPALVTAMVHPTRQAPRRHGGGHGRRLAACASLRLTHPGMPPPLHQWARSADVSTLPSGLTVAVRQFLSGRPGSLPESRRPSGSTCSAACRT